MTQTPPEPAVVGRRGNGLLNPDHVWPHEAFPLARQIAAESEGHSEHRAGIHALEQRLEAFGASLDRLQPERRADLEWENERG